MICGYILAIPLLHPGLLDFKLLQFQFHFKVFRNLLVIVGKSIGFDFLCFSLKLGDFQSSLGFNGSLFLLSVCPDDDGFLLSLCFLDLLLSFLLCNLELLFCNLYLLCSLHCLGNLLIEGWRPIPVGDCNLGDDNRIILHLVLQRIADFPAYLLLLLYNLINCVTTYRFFYRSQHCLFNGASQRRFGILCGSVIKPCFIIDPEYVCCETNCLHIACDGTIRTNREIYLIVHRSQ